MTQVLGDSSVSNADDVLELAMDASIEPLVTRFFGDAVGVSLGKTAEAIPQVALARFALSAVTYAKHQFVLKKFSKFFKTLNANDFDWQKFDKLSEKNKQMVRFTVVSTIEKQTSEIQTEAIAYLTDAFMRGQISNDIFAGVANELETINPLVFAFDSDWSQYKLNESQTKIRGSTAYLPTSFCSSNSPSLSFSSDQFLTPAGVAFFQYVYFPMRSKK